MLASAPRNSLKRSQSSTLSPCRFGLSFAPLNTTPRAQYTCFPNALPSRHSPAARKHFPLQLKEACPTNDHAPLVQWLPILLACLQCQRILLVIEAFSQPCQEQPGSSGLICATPLLSIEANSAWKSQRSVIRRPSLYDASQFCPCHCLGCQQAAAGVHLSGMHVAQKRAWRACIISSLSKCLCCKHACLHVPHICMRAGYACVSILMLCMDMHGYAWHIEYMTIIMQ
jgi:hypothetical protein